MKKTLPPDTPQVVEYFGEIMPIIVSHCCNCSVELFRCLTYEEKEDHRSFCFSCALQMQDEAWKYRELSK